MHAGHQVETLTGNTGMRWPHSAILTTVTVYLLSVFRWIPLEPQAGLEPAHTAWKAVSLAI
ncbi:hypothetical protein BN13_80033 [Nostocoides jenkinsii Ben 74]|uniref:Uncharacterized protein n=1 Tax=Nostocoides jenkinsii Ben 74 TaxID=1193518 RepID=A0A077MDE2_9MICO|nr:hypothetical protein BN13_80033 [Tetrasphaera jenkinsii Ben 74]